MATARKKAPRKAAKGKKKAGQIGLSKKERWKARLLEVLTEQGAVTTACEMAGVPRATAYLERSKDPKFSAAWDAAIDKVIDGIEDSALHRAQHGWLEPVWHKGVQVGHVRKWSDTMQIFALRQSRPEKWARAERLKVEHEGHINFQILTNVPEPDSE